MISSYTVSKLVRFWGHSVVSTASSKLYKQRSQKKNKNVTLHPSYICTMGAGRHAVGDSGWTSAYSKKLNT